MFGRKKVATEYDRYNPSNEEGLTTEQVNIRKEQGLINKTILVVGKSYWEIIRTNVLSFFNILIFALAALVIYANLNDNDPSTKVFTGTFFIVVQSANMILGLFQDLKAKYLMKKMKIITTPKTRVVRDGGELEINPEEIVLDDILVFSSGEQITCDSIITDGTVFVNEALLTGESQNILKKPGDLILSGTYLVSGKCYAKVEKVGKENYVEILATKAKAFKRNPSHILVSLRRLFRSLGVVVIALFAIVTATYAILGQFSTQADFVKIVGPLTGQFVAMIPAGLFLLTSVTLAAGVISLYTKKANVQDMYSIEMLARSDALCVDKTGTITDGTMEVKNVIPFSGFLSHIDEEEINQIVSNVVLATGDENATAIALKNYFKNYVKYDVVTALPFNSDNKYSGATFSNNVTYLIGAIEFMDLDLKEDVIKTSEEYTSKGYRVLVLAKGNNKIENNKYSGKLKALAFIILQDHIKENAPKTFEWFNENGVEIRVISGDNAVTVSEIARQAGIKNYDKYISLEGMSLEEVSKIATEYTVFGRVTPEQKEAIVIALKEAGKTVAMTGDGVNDILALKRADCSIAMNGGSQAAKNVSHVVLMNDDFATMPSIVSEGRRVINNIQRTGSLFLTKTFFAIVMCVTFWIISIATKGRYSYPFSTNNMLVWENFAIGISSFFIALEPNSEPIKTGFLRNILRRAIPSAALMLGACLVIYTLYGIQDLGLGYTGIAEFGYMTQFSRMPRYGATAIAVITFTGLAFVVLYFVCRPLSKYRAIVLGLCGGAGVLCYLIAGIKGGWNLFNIDFDTLSGENIIVIFAVFIILAAIMVFGQEIHFVAQKYRLTGKNEGEQKNED